MSKNRQVYVSGALTKLPEKRAESTKQFYEAEGCVAENVFGKGSAYIPHLRTDPVKHPNISPGEVFWQDQDRVRKALAVVANVTDESLGVGGEIDMAYRFLIPTILIYKEGEKVSRLAKGAPTIVGIIEYKNDDDALEQLKNELLKLAKENWVKLRMKLLIKGVIFNLKKGKY